jgi:hypothetical protein
MFDTACRYATVAASLSLLEISFRSFFIEERRAERWLIFCARRLSFCLARFLACGVLAKGIPLQKGSICGRGNMVNFGPKVKPKMEPHGDIAGVIWLIRNNLRIYVV